METLEQIKIRLEEAVPGARLLIVRNANATLPSSLLINHKHAVAVAQFLRDDPKLRLDYCSNVTGVDWLDRVIKTKVKVIQQVEGVDQEVEIEQSETVPGYMEAVYHLFSMTLKQGPVVIRMRTAGRIGELENAGLPVLPSLTPVYRSAELQEREIYDLFGIHFTGHPDLRRILMWDEYADHPMRKDYVEPDDYEYEPTPHGTVLEKAKKHAATRPGQDGCEQILVEKV